MRPFIMGDGSAPTNYHELAVEWNMLLMAIPKIIVYFGDSEFNFHSLTTFLELTPDRIHKSRILEQRYNQTPFTHMLFLLLEASPTPQTLFLKNVIKIVRNNDYIFSCVKSLRICKKSEFDGTYVSSFFKINSIII